MEVENIIAQHLNIDVSEVTDDKHLMEDLGADSLHTCLLYTSPSPRDATLSRMPSSA